VAYRIGVQLGDVRLSMMSYGVAVDVDIDGRRDVFRFATADPLEYVEISVPWESQLSCQMGSLLENVAVTRR